MSRKDRLQMRSLSNERKVRGTQSRVPGGSGAVETKVLRQVRKGGRCVVGVGDREGAGGWHGRGEGQTRRGLWVTQFEFYSVLIGYLKNPPSCSLDG